MNSIHPDDFAALDIITILRMFNNLDFNEIHNRITIAQFLSDFTNLDKYIIKLFEQGYIPCVKNAAITQMYSTVTYLGRFYAKVYKD